MSTEAVANSVQLPPLENPNERAAVGSELQLVLQDLIDLSLVGKQLHWSVVGAAAHGVHLFLDELVGEWRELADVVAERAWSGPAPHRSTRLLGDVRLSQLWRPVERAALSRRLTCG
ncbi:ferritin-like domain-containing protein [Kribbella sp. VKM Ac-2566]|uniref:ferritin-like domain-containing protein n=1 Tax=Kribbella sp. VKM Ac-2566 TaxID=2512218 RepID=UPI001062619D